jgi:hypothetical protein
MVLVNYECCICGDNINKDSKLDPCGMSIYTNLDKNEDEQEEQIFFCHFSCFRATLEPGVREYLVRGDQE